jgi:hypothetical protein
VRLSGRRNDGELYVVNYGGTLHHISSSRRVHADPAPASSARLVCVVASNAQTPRARMIPYAINAPFWSDWRHQGPLARVPDGHAITVRTDGDWIPEPQRADEELSASARA